MVKNYAMSITLIVIGLLIFGVVVVFAMSAIGGVTPGTGGDQRTWHECNTVVKKGLIKDSIALGSVDCVDTGSKCGFLFSIGVSNPFVILVPEAGRLDIWDSQRKLESKSFSIGAFELQQTITMKVCTLDDTLRVRLYNEDGAFIEEKTA